MIQKIETHDCQYCDDKFITYANLRDHILTDHGAGKITRDETIYDESGMEIGATGPRKILPPGYDPYNNTGEKI